MRIAVAGGTGCAGSSSGSIGRFDVAAVAYLISSMATAMTTSMLAGSGLRRLDIH
ncbi:hypothetical protein SAMN04487968_10749 [Nocardioides terrae]|uniref:Uncharacterized protein n=1 Tax=Nocardioides terrae TaxID=574651 RepID=A0A1I1JR98_9ACTN|nr:hypothetical protein [Nocardioides terrae]SFC49048.1 hypothetical protein SAMN04487968_10749 [Nocardioides terrae]